MGFYLKQKSKTLNDLERQFTVCRQSYVWNTRDCDKTVEARTMLGFVVMFNLTTKFKSDSSNKNFRLNLRTNFHRYLKVECWYCVMVTI